MVVIVVLVSEFKTTYMEVNIDIRNRFIFVEFEIETQRVALYISSFNYIRSYIWQCY
jgi:hypothetical protein